MQDTDAESIRSALLAGAKAAGADAADALAVAIADAHVAKP